VAIRRLLTTQNGVIIQVPCEISRFLATIVRDYTTKKNFFDCGDERHSSNTFYSSITLLACLRIYLLLLVNPQQRGIMMITTSMFTDLKASLLQCAIVLVPTYTVAYLTEMMVYTIPMLAASTILASSVRKREHTVDTDLDSDGGDTSSSDTSNE